MGRGLPEPAEEGKEAVGARAAQAGGGRGEAGEGVLDPSHFSFIGGVKEETQTNKPIQVCPSTQRQDAEKRAKNLEEAKSVLIKEDPSLPPAKKVHPCHLYLLMYCTPCICTKAVEPQGLWY